MDSSSAVPTARVSRSESLLRQVMTRCFRSRVETVFFERDMGEERRLSSSVSHFLALAKSLETRGVEPPVLMVATPKL